ncbi:MAG: hypothetical protein KKB31_03945 [Nanoarchaeota archaeon]|nr:hypothetical protein [Nanoarchaeota archaeon]
MKEQFRKVGFSANSRDLLGGINSILDEYSGRGIRVTLRQLYYQLVARDIIPNQTREYSKLSILLTKARYAGIIDWDAIEDRVRIPIIPQTFRDMPHLLEVAEEAYQLDRWKKQEHYIELWTEKDAISSVISPITTTYQVPLCINRGYSSASAMYDSATRFLGQEDKSKLLLYLGDHDPSGLDMDRDIQERLKEFGVDFEFTRIGLTMDQIREHAPPPNPTKITDPRARGYIELFGNTSWEVDALRPEFLQELIEESILEYLDLEKYEAVKVQERRDILKLRKR